MRTILVPGAGGQIGFELQRSLTGLGKVVALTREQMNLESETSVLKALSDYKPHIIVNAAAYTAVDRAEEEACRAMAVNSQAPKAMAYWAAENNAWIMHYSTDYVFDGLKADPYLEGDLPNPQSVYGESKWRGEEGVRSSNPHHVILRTSWIYGCHGNNFLKTILRLAQERSSLNIVADQIGAPTSASMIADVTRTIVERIIKLEAPANLWGTYHASALGSTSWHGYAEHIVRRASMGNFKLVLAQQAVKPILSSEYPSLARRPANSRLNCTKLTSCFDIVLPPWQVGVDDIITCLQSSLLS